MCKHPKKFFACPDNQNIKRRDPLEIKINKNTRVLGKGSFYEHSLRPIKMFSFCSLFRKKNKFEFVRVEICLWEMRFISLDSITSRCSSSASAERKKRGEEEKVMSSLTLHGQSALHAIHRTERHSTRQGKRAETSSSSSLRVLRLSFAGSDKLSASNVNYIRPSEQLSLSQVNRWANLPIDLEHFLRRRAHLIDTKHAHEHKSDRKSIANLYDLTFPCFVLRRC